MDSTEVNADRRKMNLLFMNPIEEEVWGGVEQWMTTVARAMKDRGHSVLVSGRPRSLWLDRSRKYGLAVIPVELKGDRNLREILTYARILTQYEIDLVCLKRKKFVRIGGLASRLCRRRPRPLVVCREGGSSIHNKLRYRLTHRWLLDTVLVPAWSIREELLSYGFIHESKIAVIPNGIDPEPYRKPQEDPRKLREELGLSGKFAISAISRPSPEKGIDTLLDAAVHMKRELPTFRILVIGEGPQRQAYERRTREMGLSEEIAFLGFRSDIPGLLHACDLFVLPSYREGRPFALLEAMAASRPVVATDVGDVSRMIEHGREGLLVPPRREEELASAILNLSADPSTAAAMGQAARERVCREFDLSTMLDRVEELFLEGLKRKSGKTG
jgi:glycosyltransferase involved in cell wall biosynthesis